jgi:hypothetical protein
MTLRSRALVVAVLLLASGSYGCATSGESRIATAPPTQIIEEPGSSGSCQWTFKRKSQPPHQHVAVKGSLRMTSGDCTVEETAQQLCVGWQAGDACKVVTVTDIGSLDFFVTGSCRYCYLNTAGGLTCVVSPRPC